MSKIKEYFQSLVKTGTIPQEPSNYDAETLKIYIDHLEFENAALHERLNKAVELPYQRRRLLWGDKDKETLLCPDCLTDLMGGIGKETFVVQCPNCGCFVDCMVEPIPFTEAAEAKFAELEEKINEETDKS